MKMSIFWVVWMLILTLFVPRTPQSGPATPGPVEGPKITSQPVDTYVPLEWSVTFYIKAEGQDLSYEWYARKPREKDFVLQTSHSSECKFPMEEAIEGTEVYCVVTDGAGNCVTSDHVFMLGTPKLALVKELEDQYVEHLGYAELHVEVIGGTPPYEYQWYSKSADAPEEPFLVYTEMFGKTEDTLRVAYHRDVGDAAYYCKITDSEGRQIRTRWAEVREAVE